MDVLIRFGFSIEEIRNMMDTNVEIGNIDDEILTELIVLLKSCGCDEETIKNILVANPFYLNRNIEDVKELIAGLKESEFDFLDIVFDSNPFILNMERDEFLELISKKKSEGLTDLEVQDFISYDLI